MVAILSQQKEHILEAVRAMYTDVATCPTKTFHFPTGRAACHLVGYPDAELDLLPPTAVESFAGVGYPFRADVIRAGDHVLDIGSGSGTDLLIAARQVTSRGKVFGLDVTEAMRNKLRENAARACVDHAEILAGNAEEIPLPDASIDVVTSNGVLNLVLDKPRALREIRRVLRPGGRLQLADIVVGRAISETSRQNPRLWAECIVGAVREEWYLETLVSLGFTPVESLHRHDYFAASTSAETRKVAASFAAEAVVLRAHKPA